MPSYTRGEFLGISATLAAALGLGQVPGREKEAKLRKAPAGGDEGDDVRQGNVEPDLALVNGRVFTVDDGQPQIGRAHV